MEAQKIKEYNVSRMSIEKNVISWEGHAVRLPGYGWVIVLEEHFQSVWYLSFL